VLSPMHIFFNSFICTLAAVVAFLQNLFMFICYKNLITKRIHVRRG
jgi:hypothetical protein